MNPYLTIIDKLRYGGPMKVTPEVDLIIHVIGQAIKDAMGLEGADKQLILEKRVDRQWIGKTQQQEAIDWFKSNGHYHLCDVVEINPSWLTHLLKKNGVLS